MACIPFGRTLQFLACRMLGILCLVLVAVGNAGSAQPQVAASGYSSFVIDSAGQLMGWGDDGAGQLASGRLLQSNSLRALPGSYVAVASGWGHTVALKSDGSVWAWGGNWAGQLGDGTTTYRSTPIQVGSGFKAISAGYNHTVALKTDGSLWAWGDNSSGQLGDGTTTQRNSPVLIGGGFAKIAAGGGQSGSSIYDIGGHTLALKTDGTLWAWGENSLGQVGDGSTTDRHSPVQIGTDFQFIAAGSFHSLAIKTNGTLWAWGAGNSGQLGSGSGTDRNTPVQVGTGYTAVAGGHLHTVGLKSDGSLWTWGDNSGGQLGDGGASTNRYSPYQIGAGYTAIAAGQWHNLGVRSGALMSWGWNAQGQLGDGSAVMRSAPVQIRSSFSGFLAAAGYQSFALETGGTLWGCGWNIYGQLADGVVTQRSIPVVIGSGYGAVAAGAVHTLGLRTDGYLFAWGWNQTGALGDGTVTPSSVPKLIGTGYKAVAAGDWHSLALKTDGSLWAWGDNSHGQLGLTASGSRLTPTSVGSGFKAIAAGSNFSLVVANDGSLYQLGSGYFVSAQVGSGYTAVAAGYQHALALKSDGSLYAWGDNSFGQLGDGTTTAKPGPSKIGSGFVAIFAGYSNSFALKADGTLWGWGANESGQLGDGSTSNRLVPTLIGSDYSAVAAGRIDVLNYKKVAKFTVGIKTDGTVWSWGSNYGGHLGDGTFASRPAPGLVLNAAGNDLLDLNPAVPNLPLPAGALPTLFVNMSETEQVAATINYDAAQLNHAGSVYFFGLLPADSPLLSGTILNRAVPGTTGERIAAGSDMVTVVITPDGIKHYTGGDAPPYYSGNLGDDQKTFPLADINKFDRAESNGVICSRVTTTGDDSKTSPPLVTGKTRMDCPVVATGGTATFSPSGGLWVVDAENNGQPGRGFQIEIRNNVMVATVYAYDGSGNSIFYLASGAVSSNSFTGDLNYYSGGMSFGAAQKSATLTGAAGKVSISFTDSTHGTITFPGEAAKKISKFNWSATPGSLTTSNPVGGLWVIDAENNGQPGRGFQIEVQSGVLVATVYAYEASGASIFYLASGNVSGGVFSGDLNHYQGGMAFGAAQKSATLVGSAGTVSMSFSDSSHGTITFPGEAAKAISKFVW
jgi:alpha-tubulin suppressor-like RCC1 family protein